MSDIIGAEDVWLVDGVDLRTYAWNIEAITAGMGLPPKRGDNLRVPFRHGTRHSSKYYDQRALTLSMFVDGCDPDDGSVPTGDQARLTRLYDNLRRLRQLFGRTDRLLTLTHVLPGGNKRTAEIEVIGTLDFDSVAGALARFAVDVNMPDPFWYGLRQIDRVVFGPKRYGVGAVYGDDVVDGIPLDYAYELAYRYGEGHLYDVAWASPQSWTVNYPGNYETDKMLIIIKGSCQNPRITHADGSYVEVLVTMAFGEELVIDTENFTAELDGNSVIGSLRHQGTIPFFKLYPGDNVLSLTSDITPAAVTTITFKPRYL